MIANPASLHFELPKGFIVLEGVNGAGKSSLLTRLKAFTASLGFEVLTSFEPGATPLGKDLRRALLEGSAGKIVLCDRFLYSTIAFQGYGRGLDRNVIDQLNELAAGQTLPDLVLLLDLDAEEGLRRTKGRSSSTSASAPDSFEAEQLSFHEALRKGFLEIARERPEPFVILDAAKSADEVFEASCGAIKKLLARIRPGLGA